MERKIVLSIIIPVFNVENYLRKCVDTVLIQDEIDIEVILVNDGSTDSSASICDEYADSDKRVKVIHQDNGGLSVARNSGLELATGDYLWFVDSDDWIASNSLEVLNTKITQNKSLEMIGFSVVDYYEDLNEYMCQPVVESIESTNGSNYIFKNKLFYPSVCSYIYNVNFLHKNEIKFKPNIIHEDDYFNLSCFARVTKIMKIPSTLYYYRRRANSIMTSEVSVKKIESYIAILALCEELKISRLDGKFIENQIFKYLIAVMGLLKELKVSTSEKNQFLNKVHSAVPTLNLMSDDFGYIILEKKLYNKKPVLLYLYINYCKYLKYASHILYRNKTTEQQLIVL